MEKKSVTPDKAPHPFVYPMEKSDAFRLSPAILAYVGDAAYELVARVEATNKGWPADKLHRLVVTWVSAEGQAYVLSQIEDRLTPEEADVVRRGRNVKTSVPRRADVATYRRSTAFEALCGYLCLTGQSERMRDLISIVIQGIEKGEGPADG